MVGGVRSTAMPANSSAPMSGVDPFRASPSISVATPTAAPPDSSCVAVAAGMWRSVVDVKGAADVVAKEMALTFEAFVRDMLRPPAEEAPAEPEPKAEAPKPTPAAPPSEAAAEPPAEDPDAPKKSDFWS